MTKPSFTKMVVGVVNNDVPPGAMNTFSTVGDINSDGMPDIALCGRNGVMVWLENKGPGREWEKHLVDEVDKVTTLPDKPVLADAGIGKLLAARIVQ